MKKMIIILALLIAALISKAQDSLSNKTPKDTAAKKPVEKPIADSVEYISNKDLDKIYRMISDNTNGTTYFNVFLPLDNAIKTIKREAADRYRKRKQIKN